MWNMWGYKQIGLPKIDVCRNRPLLREWDVIARPGQAGTAMKTGKPKESREAGVDKVIRAG